MSLPEQPVLFDPSDLALPYRELLESFNDERCKVPNYPLLLHELKRLEAHEPGEPPDHPADGSKDVADPCAAASAPIAGLVLAMTVGVLEAGAALLLARVGEQLALWSIRRRRCGVRRGAARRRP